jgi:hypothetical protein
VGYFIGFVIMLAFVAWLFSRRDHKKSRRATKVPARPVQTAQQLADTVHSKSGIGRLYKQLDAATARLGGDLNHSAYDRQIDKIERIQAAIEIAEQRFPQLPGDR